MKRSITPNDVRQMIIIEVLRKMYVHVRVVLYPFSSNPIPPVCTIVVRESH